MCVEWRLEGGVSCGGVTNGDLKVVSPVGWLVGV